MSKIDLKKALLPISVLGIFLLFYLAWRFFALPPEEEILEIARFYFDRYGLAILLVSALIEGTVLIGWYYPGSLIIFLGVILAGKDIPKVAEAVMAITVGLFFAYIINFLLGKYGWYRLLLKFGLREALEDVKKRVTKHGLVAIFMSYWQPNLAALVATSAGILDFSFKKFFIYSLVAATLWNTFWGTLVYFVGEGVLSLVGIRFVLLAIFLWIIYRIWNGEGNRGAKNIDMPTP
ncbi:MAG: VTT domain-containing protein [bacterium]|nr:VTT domain-containing protein [bacterium]MDZ4205770.1 VTT domain-containing protein [Patescibacteria group bacterium]